MGDAASPAKAGHSTPNGSLKVPTKVTLFARRGGQIRVCGSCLDTRLLSQDEFISGAMRTNMDELTALAVDAHNVMVF